MSELHLDGLEEREVELGGAGGVVAAGADAALAVAAHAVGAAYGERLIRWQVPHYHAACRQNTN